MTKRDKFLLETKKLIKFMFEKIVEFFIVFDDELERGLFVIVGVYFKILDYVVELMISLGHAGRLVFNVTKMNVQMIERRLVVNERAQFVLFDAELFLDGL